MATIDSILICDDVRRELGGKLSLLGLYRGQLLVHEEIPARPNVLGLDRLVFVVPMDRMTGVRSVKLRMTVSAPGGELAADVTTDWRERSEGIPADTSIVSVNPFPLYALGDHRIHVEMTCRMADGGEETMTHDQSFAIGYVPLPPASPANALP